MLMRTVSSKEVRKNEKYLVGGDAAANSTYRMYHDEWTKVINAMLSASIIALHGHLIVRPHNEMLI